MEQHLGLTLLQTITQDPGILGSLVKNMYDFIESGLDSRLEIYDRINERRMLARDYFSEQGYKRLVIPDCLPLDFDVKAAFVERRNGKKSRPVLELSTINLESLTSMAEESESFLVKDDKVYAYKKQIAKIQSITGRLPRVGRRTRSRILFATSEDTQTQLGGIRLANFIYENNIFLEDSASDEQATRASLPSINMTQEEVIKATIEYEQVPLQIQRFGQNAQAIQSLQILQLSTQEILQRMEQLNMDIRDIMPYVSKMAIARIQKCSEVPISWKQASSIYWRLVKKNSVT